MAEETARPRHWLLKTEPDAYSIDTLERERIGHWDGVRNFQARNLLREMKVGELALFYHSSTKPPGPVGLCRVCKEAYPDPSQFDPNSKYFDPKSSPEDPRWSMVDVEFVSRLPRQVTLDDIKAEPALGEMVLVKRSRLSVQPTTREELELIVRMGGGTLPAAGKKKAAAKTTAAKTTAAKKKAKRSVSSHR